MAKKYIDAEKLISEIERLKDEYTDIAIDSQRGWVNANSVIDDLEQLQSQIDSLQQEQQEVDLEKFTKKMDAWKARYNNYPDNIIVKGTMAFTARMFYMYPNIAMEWYDSLPKVTQD